ncbi:MAG TPA: DUF6249 domain-containing protein [Hyphomonas sp.]|nr:hypothetical protein [Hyphomonas sp.]HRJ02312.1 DUF6249 domain-containing protein [Hyphomonas sp.]
MEDVMVPVVLFLTPAVIVWIVSYFNSRKRTTIHETLRHAIDKGQELSPDLLEKMSLVTDPVRADLRRGVLFLAFGAAFGVLGALIGMEESEAVRPMLGVAAFPVFMGIAYIGLWAFGRGKSEA